MKKIVLFAAVMLAMASCTSNKVNESETAVAETETVAIETAPLFGEWELGEYTVDNKTTKIDAEADYTLVFNEADNNFGLTTDCNSLLGTYIASNDTIRFSGIGMTRMYCPDAVVEEAMLKLFNDSTTYALRSGNTLTLTAPAAGSATFIRK